MPIRAVKKSMKLVRKLDEVDKKAQENHIVCVGRDDKHSKCVEKRNYEWILLDH